MIAKSQRFIPIIAVVDFLILYYNFIIWKLKIMFKWDEIKIKEIVNFSRIWHAPQKINCIEAARHSTKNLYTINGTTMNSTINTQ